MPSNEEADTLGELYRVTASSLLNDDLVRPCSRSATGDATLVVSPMPHNPDSYHSPNERVSIGRIASGGYQSER